MSLPGDLATRLEAALGARPERLRPLSGGCVGEVYGLEAGGTRYALKVDRQRGGALAVEGRMLDHLARHTALPAPRPVAWDEGFLLMSWVEGAPSPGPAVEEHAADLLAALHGQGTPAYGFDFATVIGGLPQPNPWTEDWATFYGRHRLVAMARQAFDAGNLPADLLARAERLADALPGLLGEPNPPGLVHGDVWGGNVMAAGGRITGFLDPALHYADPEVELAFITLFSTFGERFFARYRERRPLSADFWTLRRELYLLYPLLVHARLFGGHYVSSVAALLRRFAPA